MKNQLEKWQVTQDKGRKSFIIKYGVMGWGLKTGILFALVFPFFLDTPYSIVSFLLVLIPSLILFPLGGILWGLYMWNFFERQHDRVSDGSEDT